MPHQRFLWRYPTSVPEDVQNDLDTFSPAIQSVLYQRGINTLEDALSFLLPKAPGWYSNINLLHVEKACQLILDSIQDKEVIAVYGDYDADGITSTALVTLALREIGAIVIPYIPDRQNEGYGLNTAAIKSLSEQGTSLLITVDNGIRSLEEVACANSHEMKVIITDHHTPGNELPPAAALLNPKLPDDPYPNKNLAGVGVAYKLICALSERVSRLNPDDYLDLVAIGTVADIVPLNGENRYLVRRGLSKIKIKNRQSIQSLLSVSGIMNRTINASDISYQIAPRLNSSGRLDSESALTPLNLLLNSDLDECSNYAQIIEIHNDKRKSLSRKLETKVENFILDEIPLPPLLMVFSSDISIGLAGIAAGFLSRKYNLPAIVGQTGEDTSTASCRSIPDFNIIKALDSCQELFVHYGGHTLAAGFTIENDKIPQLKEFLVDQASVQLKDSNRLPTLEIDAEVSLKDLDRSLYAEIEKLEPTGAGNSLPVFVTNNLKAIKPKRVGKNSNHLKMVVSDGNISMDTIGFGLGDLIFDLPPEFDLAYHLKINYYLGTKTLQLQVLDLVPS